MDTKATETATNGGGGVSPDCAGPAGSDLRVFAEREIKAAHAHADAGGQALHLMGGRWAYLRDDTPSCFKGSREIAHLFDNDKARLICTAKRFGVRVILVEREARPGQHIDLCGKPLERAKELAAQLEWERDHGLTLDGQNNPMSQPASRAEAGKSSREGGA